MDADPSSDGTGTPRFRYRFADVEFDEAAMVLRVAGRPVTVEPLPLGVLLELLQRPNEAVSRDTLLDRLWADRPPFDHAITSAVSKLRQALGPEGRQRVESVHGIGYRFAGPLAREAVGHDAARPAPLRAGQAVPYRPDHVLVKPLGPRADGAVWLAQPRAGGPGTVFKFAHDTERLGALKREYTVSRLLRRELGERADFARVLDANFASRPFFVELAWGGPDLAAFAAARGPGWPREERLAVFVQIASAVAAAHGVGVLHKDLKPGNVLVDDAHGAPQVQLIDFGSSRLLEPGRLAALGVTAMGLTLTADGGTSGTPLYLAPELIAGQPPSVASDVFALGLILYQLITGDFRRPLSTGWVRDIDDPLLAEDIAAATEGEPMRRLPSAAALVQRLSTLPARRAERAAEAEHRQALALLAERERRSRARRPWVAAALASLALGLAASLVFHARAVEALAVATAESARAQAINDFMHQDVLQSADVLRTTTDRAVTLFDVLERASQSAAARFAQQPRTEASVHRRLGEIYLRMQYLAQAEREFARALDLLQGHVPADDPELLALRFAAVQTSVGLFRPAEALQRLQQAEQAAGPAALAAPTDLARRALRARVDVLLDTQRPADALPQAERLVTLSDALAGDGDLPLRIEARQRLAEVQLRLGRQAEAEALFAELERPPFGAAGVADALSARARLRQGRELINAGRLDEAEAVLTRVRDAVTRNFSPSALYAGGANMELADVHLARGHFAPAIAAAQGAAQAFATALGEQHFYTLNAAANLAALELEAGQTRAALARLEALRPLAAADRNAAPLVAGIDFARGRALVALGRAAEGLALLEGVSAEQLAEASWGPRDFQWQLQAERALALGTQGRHAEAKRLLREAVEGLRAAGSYPWRQARYRALLARGP